MATASYDLYLGSMKIGRVIKEDSDFPNLWGRITYDEALSRPRTPEEKRFARFLELEQESIRLVDLEHEQEVSSEQEAVDAQLEAYQDYIETDDWFLVDERGNKLLIMCPILRYDGGIVWRWNPKV
jgi:hypothetical protein